MPALGTLEALLGAMNDLAAEKPRAVHIKGLGDVFIREITVGEIDEQIADTAESKDKRAIARGACRLLCDENGKRLMDPTNADHVSAMARLPVRVLKAINEASEDKDSAGN